MQPLRNIGWGEMRIKFNHRAESIRLSPEQRQGVVSTVMASFFLGWAPILGKLAYLGGVMPFTLAAIRTMVAALLLWLAFMLFWHQ